MDACLNICRAAFRRAHGLPEDAPLSLDPARAQAFCEWARRHRVQGLLFAGIPELAESLQTAAFGQTRFAAQATEVAGKLFTRLKTRLPNLTLVKGPALATHAWPEPGMRSFDDLDILCGKCSFAVMRTRLQTAGCALDVRDRRRARNLWHFGWGVPFRAENHLLVEVKSRFFPPHYPWPKHLTLTQDRLFTELTLDGAEVRAPTPALHLLLCSLHAAWHGWERMAWLVDIGGLLVRQPGVYQEAQALTRRHPFARRALDTSCGMAIHFFGLNASLADAPPVPAPILAQVTDLLNGTARPLRSRQLRALHESLMTCREIITYRLRRALIPGDGDFRWIALSPALRWLYWPLRPLRIIWRSATRT